MWYVYYILCADDSIYIGVTGNIDRRMREHTRSEGAKYTRDHKATKLLRTEQFNSKREALKREKQVKGWRREKKINLIQFGHPNGR